MAALLKELIGKNTVVIFAWESCPYCQRAKALLTGLSKDVAYLNLQTMPNGDAIHQAIIAQTNHETVPAIYIRQQFKGGFSDVDGLHRSGQLVPLLTGS